MNKRITSICLAVVMICSILVTSIPAYAAVENGLDVSKTEVFVGESFTVTLVVPAVNELSNAASFKVAFDKDAFELVSYVAPTVEGMSKMQSTVAASNNSGEFSATYDSISYEADVTWNKVQFEATFTVKESAVIDEYMFTVKNFSITGLTDYGTPKVLTPAGTVKTATIEVVPAPVDVTGVSLDRTSLTLEVGETDTLVATVAPNEATNKNVTWSSNNAAVTVDQDGKVTANSIIDEAVITVTTEDGGKTATCKVKVVAATCKHTGGSKHYEAKAANCKVGGNIEYWECNDCKAKFSDEALTSSVADVATPIDPNKHGEKTHYDAKPATCKVGGNIEYWECNDCKVKFSDEALNTPVDVVATPVDPNAHGSFVEGGEHLKAGATCTTNEFYYKVCERCGAAHATETWEKTATKLGHDMAPADCLNPATCKRNCGYTEGVKLGHDFANGEYGMNATQHWKICARTGCEEKDTAVDHSFVDKICTVCGYDANCKHETVTHHDAVAATCVATGNIEYWECDNETCKVKFRDAAKTDIVADVTTAIDSNNHVGGTKLDDNKVNPTCSQPGKEADTLCASCEAKLQDGAAIPAQHTLAKVAGTAPTCSVAGKVDTWVCSGECGKTYIDAAATVEADSVNVVIPKDADNHVGGEMKYDAEYHWGLCVCGETIDKEAHKGGTANCTVKAICSVCKQSYGEIDADAHNWVNGVCQNNSKHVQTLSEVETVPGQTVVTTIPEKILTAMGGNTTKFLASINAVIEQKIQNVETSAVWSNLFVDGSINVVEGQLLYELQPDAPEGTYTIEVPVGNSGDVYVIEITVAQDDLFDQPDRPRPNRPAAVPAEVKDVIGLINDLPSAKKVTLDDEELIEDARKAYEKLSKANQAKVSNYADLVAAEEALEALKEAAAEVVENPFVDVDEDAYYADAVLWAIENNITAGTSIDTFSPEAVCTRAQVVTFLWRAAGCPAPLTSDMPFADVEAGAYYAAAVQWAVENNITAGTAFDAFDPNGECTRAQIVTFLWRAQGNPAAAAVGGFEDVEDGAYYDAPVVWAVANGITNGTSATTFSPAADCTRAQVVTFLYRCLAE